MHPSMPAKFEGPFLASDRSTYFHSAATKFLFFSSCRNNGTSCITYDLCKLAAGGIAMVPPADTRAMGAPGRLDYRHMGIGSSPQSVDARLVLYAREFRKLRNAYWIKKNPLRCSMAVILLYCIFVFATVWGEIFPIFFGEFTEV